MINLSLKLPLDIDERLSFLSHKTGRTKSYYVREAIIERLDELEDIYLSLSRIEKPAKYWTLNELEKEVDL